MNRTRKLLTGIVLIISGIFVYDQLLLNNIQAKEDPDLLRIGYINLHESKIRPDELKKLQAYNCDLWLFLEWTGDNLDNEPSFAAGYLKVSEVPDQKISPPVHLAAGICVLSKDRQITVAEIGNRKRPYLCDYPKHLITYKQKKLNIYLVHAPPPVPKCGMETPQYIADLIAELQKEGSGTNSIVIGDLNSVPFQKAVNDLKRTGYKDSQSSLSTLPEGTFNLFTGFPKIVKIDYVFHKGNIAPKQVKRFSLRTSDHSGWVADFDLKCCQ